jgi:hypothetical protein
MRASPQLQREDRQSTRLRPSRDVPSRDSLVDIRIGQYLAALKTNGGNPRAGGRERDAPILKGAIQGPARHFKAFRDNPQREVL